MAAKEGKLRGVKTKKALNMAMLSLLESRNFKKITVSDICDGALISRVTFYTYFTDKYDLLKEWLVWLKPNNEIGDEEYEKIEESINEFVYENATIIKNLIDDANEETIGIILDFILHTSKFINENDSGIKSNHNYTVLSNFYAGGIFHYFLWQAQNKFSLDVKPMNIHLYKIIKEFQEWKSK